MTKKDQLKTFKSKRVFIKFCLMVTFCSDLTINYFLKDYMNKSRIFWVVSKDDY